MSPISAWFFVQSLRFYQRTPILALIPSDITVVLILLPSGFTVVLILQWSRRTSTLSH
jgi:hypothetical protein